MWCTERVTELSDVEQEDLLDDQTDEVELEAPPATGTWRDVADVGTEEARVEWAEAARGVLIETAGTYRAVLLFKELAAEVQYRSGVRTKQPNHYWISDVLSRVSRECAARDEPLLSTLCVNAEGSVGAAYADLVRELTGTEPADPDQHAAEQRLACYRRYDAVGLPADGGSPALAPKLSDSRSRARKAARLAKPVATCPKCMMALLPTGVCDTCD